MKSERKNPNNFISKNILKLKKNKHASVQSRSIAAIYIFVTDLQRKWRFKYNLLSFLNDTVVVVAAVFFLIRNFSTLLIQKWQTNIYCCMFDSSRKMLENILRIIEFSTYLPKWYSSSTQIVLRFIHKCISILFKQMNKIEIFPWFYW